MQAQKKSKSIKVAKLYKLKKPLPSVIVNSVIDTIGSPPNVNAMARLMNVAQPRLWQFINCRNRWPADEWIKVMICLGRVHETTDHFTIVVPKLNLMCDVYDDLAGFDPLQRLSRGVKTADETFKGENAI